MADRKEINYFSDPSNWDRGRDWYRDHFSHCSPSTTVGEASVDYLYHKTVPSRVYKEYPDTTFIAILRDPVDRAYSAYQYFAGDLHGDDFRDALRERPSLLERGLYGRQLARYLSLFNLSDFAILFYSDIVQDNATVYRQVCDFLNVSQSTLPNTIGRSHNASILPRLVATLEKMGLEQLISITKSLGLDKPVRRLHYCLSQFRTVKSVFDRYADLYSYFESDTELLEKLIQRRVPWRDKVIAN